MSKAKDVYDRMMDQDYCSQWMGVEPVQIEEGHCSIQMTVKKEMLNGFGILHGGIAYAFADSAFAFASNSYGRVAVSIQGSMNFLKSASEGDVLVAEANALNVTHKTADFDVVVTNKQTEERLYLFRGTVYRSSKEHLA
ncbi:hotdog fold thioesterase [Marinoscillum sp.]|uniref:hotdog fold thioesterase n=1 Tax=Marinoscillum sp. TaxID=2024838 RepID=UPI003BA952A7